MNKAVLPFLNKHIEEYELECSQEKSFEHFFNYLTVRNYTSRHFDPEEISLGKGEVGIDGIAIIANDTLVTSMQQAMDIFNSDADVSASIIFVQSKTSESFESSELTQFFAAVNDFIKQGNVNTNSKATELRNIFNYIISNPIKLYKNPDCHLFYSYTGKINEDKTREALVSQQIIELKRTSFFDNVTFILYDADKIISSCRAIKNNVKKTIKLVDCAVIPHINNINEAYIGVAKCTDFIHLITNDDDAIMSNLFEDNVRYFQGHNTINAEIQETLIDKSKQEEFSVLNNGVTIVTRDMRRTGNDFTFNGFQIINGCQTSFVLYENRTKLTDNSYITIKIISTDNEDVTNSIVKTANRQTPVLNEAFETLRDFHKKLELVYASYNNPYKLFYERRSKQYDSSDINKNKIISFPFQTTAYIAVFLEEPQSTHRYYGELLKSYSKKLYKENDVLEQYCIASIYVYVIESFLKHNNSFFEYKKYKFHIALMLRILANSNPLPNSNDKKMKSYCDELFKRISNETWVSNQIEKCCKIIDEVIKNGDTFEKNGNDETRSKDFTSKLLENLGVESTGAEVMQLPRLKKEEKVYCKVLYWNSSFAYVSLIDYNEKGSIHIRYISKDYITSIDDYLKVGQIIEAVILDDVPNPVFGYQLSMVDAR